MKLTQIEFTDRYGGRAPSWLRGCHGPCEAMGYVPVYQIIASDGLPLDPNNDSDPRLVRQWNAAHAELHEEPCDGWHFVKCPDCGGSGRSSWLRTVALIPRWLTRGARFMPIALRKEAHPPEWPLRRRLWVTFKAAFLCDLGVRM